MFRIRFQCGCGFMFDKASVFSWSDSADIPGGTGSANLVQKCKECGKTGSCEITSKAGDFKVTAEDDGKAVKVASFDCRGLEPKELVVSDGYTVTAGTASWRDQDLSEAAGKHSAGWSEYDEETDVSFTVSEVSASFELDKGGKKK